MEYNLYIKAKNELTEKLKSLFKNYIKSGVELKDIKSWLNKKSNIKNLLKDISYESYQYFNSDSEYENFVKENIKEVLNDLIAVKKDNIYDMNENNFYNLRCPQCGYFINSSKQFNFGLTTNCPQCSTPVHTQADKIHEVKGFDQFFNKLEPLNEMKIPVMKIDELLDSVSNARSSHKYVIAALYKIPQDYIDFTNKKKHHFKVNDMRGDVLGNSRVVFDVYVFDDNDIITINDNIIDYCVEDFMNQLPENLNVFGINISPMSFIDKEELKKTFEMTINLEETKRIIGEILDFEYEMKIDNFHIWSNKNKIS